MPPTLAWWHATRPHTLSLSAMPVLAGCALAWRQGAAPQWTLALVTLLAALCIQLGVNLLNDVGDFERGADGPDRLGPPRATAQGWLRATTVRRAGLSALAAAFMLGLWLAWAGGWPIAMLGLLALACGWCYTAGPRPIAYGPWGEAFVWCFFGLAAVAGTAWLQAHTLSPAALWMGHALGAQAAAVMLVNNTRDAASDARAGKHTIAVRLGRRNCNALYPLLLAQPYLCWHLLLPASASFWRALPWLTLPAALWLTWRFTRQPATRAMNTLLSRTAQLQVVWGLLSILALYLA